MRPTRRPHASLLLVAIAVAALACADQGGELSTSVRQTSASDSGGTRGDTTVRTDTGTRGDSTVRGDTAVGSTIPGVHGRVWGWMKSASDTGIYVGVAGAKVELVITPIDSMGPGDTAIVVTSTTSAADGTFLIPTVADGWYGVRATPPAASPYGRGITYGVTVKNDLMTDRKSADVYLQPK